MKRDFSDSAKDELMNMVKQVENEKWCDFTDWIGDRWYDFQDWIGKLDIKNYINNINEYHKKVIDKNNASMESINKIFEEVNCVSTNYKNRLSISLSDLKSYNHMLFLLSNMVTPANGKFDAKFMESNFKNILTTYINKSIDIQKQATDGLTLFRDEFDLQNIVTIKDIPKNDIKEVRNINIKEWHPFLGFTQTMMDNVDEPSEGGISTKVDTFAFVTSWIGNSTEITQLRVITSNDGQMTIEYGTPIEQKYSGKHISLSSVIADKYYNYSPSIIFTSGDKADEYIRSWFGLTGNGKYSMDFNFGKVYIGEFGYKLVFEDGELFQVPIINKDTTMKVYYKENGKAKFMFDAVDILRNTKIKVSEEETQKLLKQLKDTGFIY